MPKEEFEEVNLFDEDKDLAEKDAAERLVSLEAEDEAPESDEVKFVVPEKFAGKSLEDVITSYTNLESEYGRKNNEVGELRKLTDEILRQKVQPQEADQASNEVGFDELIEDPNAAIDKALANNPRLAAIEAEIQTTAQANAHKAILARHEDADTVVASPEFQSWVAGNPSRQKMFADASNNLDAGTAAEMLDMYKSSVQMKTDAAIEARDDKASEGMKLAANEKGGKTPAKSKKIYKRAELIKLKIHKPREYEKMAPIFNLAYAEGRVR